LRISYLSGFDSNNQTFFSGIVWFILVIESYLLYKLFISAAL
jgi:hypothetical protein